MFKTKTEFENFFSRHLKTKLQFSELQVCKRYVWTRVDRPWTAIRVRCRLVITTLIC